MVPTNVLASQEASQIRESSPIRPGGDYDVSLNYRIEDEHQRGETSTAGMVRSAIQEADAQEQRVSSVSHCSRWTLEPTSQHLSPERSERSTSRHRDEVRRGRSVAPYRRVFRGPFDSQYRDERRERSGTPRSRRREVSHADSSLNEG